MEITIQETDRLQRVVARLVATSPAGVNLLLIGGFRYRLLDNSQRFSVDIDYHATAIQKVIDEQIDSTVAMQMNSGGGGRVVLDAALSLLLRVCLV